MKGTVAHVVRRFVKEHWGGTEEVIAQLSTHLNSFGISSNIFTTQMLSNLKQESISGLRVQRYPYSFPWFGLSKEAKQQMALKGGNPLSLALFQALLREPELQLIHSHVQLRLGGIARSVARLRKIPYVVSLHGGFYTLDSHQAKLMQKPFEGKWEWGKAFGWLFGSRRVLADADAIFCVGKDEYQAVQEQFPQKRVVLSPNGVNISSFHDADPMLFKSTYQIPNHHKLLLSVARIDPQKNQLLLVQAFQRLLQENPDLHLVLIGPITVDSYWLEIEEFIKKNGLGDRVLHVNGLPSESPLITSAYKGAELFILPSQMEPFGIVILEAWAAQTPVLASKVGGIPGFTEHERDIFHFNPNQLEDLIEGIKILLKNPQYKKELVHNAFQKVQNYEWKKIARDTASIYEELSQEKKYEKESRFF